VAARGGVVEWFVGGTFAFDPGDEAEALARMKALLVKRVATQPLSQPNAGSVFRNPPGDHAARLIEAWRPEGVRRRRAQVSNRHSNFIVNRGLRDGRRHRGRHRARAGDGEEDDGLDLVREVRIVGEKGGANG